MQSKDGISSKQFVVLLFLVTLAIKMFMLPSLILRTVGKDGYLIIIAYTLFEFVGLGLLLAAVVRNPDKTLFDILSDATGKVVSRIIVTFIIAFALVKATIVISEIKMFFAVIMYRDINWVILAVPLFCRAYGNVGAPAAIDRSYCRTRVSRSRAEYVYTCRAFVRRYSSRKPVARHARRRGQSCGRSGKIRDVVSAIPRSSRCFSGG